MNHEVDYRWKARGWARLGLLLSMPFLALSSGWAQQPATAPQPPALSSRQSDPNAPAPPYKELASIHIQSSLVVAPVTVIDRSGQFVENLSQDDFRVLDNGVEQRITRFGPDVEPVALVIVVQTSESVAPLLGQVRPLGSLFSDLLVGKKGEAAVICFDDRVRLAQNFSNDPVKLGQTLRQITSESHGARLNDALGRAILMLANRPIAERRVIVVFSEGLDHGSETTRAEIVLGATGAGVAIYGLRFRRAETILENQQQPEPPNALDMNMARPGPPGRPQTPNTTQTYNSTPISGGPVLSAPLDALGEIRRHDLVRYYAAYTGGTTFTHWKANELQQQLTRVALEMNSQYLVAYVPSTLSQLGFHRIQVQVLQPKVKVRARAGYFYELKRK